MHVYDISLGFSPDLLVWPGDPPVKLERLKSIEDGAISNDSRIEFVVHAGTHVDAPVHYLQQGGGVETLSIKTLIGRAYVVDLPEAEILDETTLENAGIPSRTRRVLFKTRNSNYWERKEQTFQTDFVGVDPSGAHWLVRKGVQLVGIDYLSIAPYNDLQEPHQILLEGGIVIVEGLNLSEVSQGRYTLYCLPIKILGSDGAPARAVLFGV